MSRPARHALFASLLLSAPWAPALAGPPSAPLNDTGLTMCVKPGLGLTRDCAGTGQDGEFGRDATAPGPANGRAGFSFVKLDADGQPLPRDASTWPCVHDKVTGLVWESKTHDGSLHDGSARFDNQEDGAPGDASALVAAANAANLCGAHDWRLPTLRELTGLIDYSREEGSPMIDLDWFPDTAAAPHWTTDHANINAGGPHYRWAVNYASGRTFWNRGDFGPFAVRLVRRGHPVSDGRWVANAAEVRDRSTGLVWRRCAEGQHWDGAACAGTPSVFLTASDALAHAHGESAATGKPWREPNVKELASLVDTRVNEPAINRTAFPGAVCGSCYTSTRWADNPVVSWRVEFAEGNLGVNFWGGNMMLVRDAD